MTDSFKEIQSSSSFASASALSAINIPQRKYDVFLSFRGSDTRNSFSGHLYEALLRNKIETFVDDKLRRGDEISTSITEAIEGSTISIIVFSERYASSRWCLDELVKILECKKMYGQIVIPIFYRVDPSDVTNQTGPFRDSFLQLEERFKERSEKLQKWRVALKEAANLSGFDSSVIRSDSALVEKIIEHILKKLHDPFSSDVNKDLVGIESCIQEIESLLSYGDVRTLGIWGMGGIGKTAIASVIFSRISRQFESSFFAQNIREEFEKSGSLIHWQRELLSTLLENENLTTSIPNFSLNFTGKRLTRKKVLIVLDDVTNYEQIEFLIGSLDRFMAGSRIIITTRNKQILRNCRVNNIYKMKELAIADALTLFSRHAFEQNHPLVGYEELSEKIMQYTQGVPLAIKVLGSFLYGKSKEGWESAVGKLKNVLPQEIQNVLKISYDDLSENEQNIFLHIACFLEDENRDFVVGFLKASGFSAEIGISVLVDKCLIVESDNMITTHYLLKQMGRNIVLQEYTNDVRKSINDLRKRSRIDLKKIFTIANFVLEIPSAVFDKLSPVYKPHYVLVNMSLSFVAMLLCIIELVYRCGKKKVTWKWRGALPWLYHPSKTHSKPFGNLEDIIELIGLLCAICQCTFATINFDFLLQHADIPLKSSFWPIIFAFGLLMSKFSKKLVRRSSWPISRSTSTNRLQKIE